MDVRADKGNETVAFDREDYSHLLLVTKRNFTNVGNSVTTTIRATIR